MSCEKGRIVQTSRGAFVDVNKIDLSSQMLVMATKGTLPFGVSAKPRAVCINIFARLDAGSGDVNRAAIQPTRLDDSHFLVSAPATNAWPPNSSTDADILKPLSVIAACRRPTEPLDQCWICQGVVGGFNPPGDIAENTTEQK